jgi:hypothetical protein
MSDRAAHALHTIDVLFCNSYTLAFQLAEAIAVQDNHCVFRPMQNAGTTQRRTSDPGLWMTPTCKTASARAKWQR